MYGMEEYLVEVCTALLFKTVSLQSAKQF